MLLLLLACKDKSPDDTGPAAWAPELACPGAAGCETASGALRAGAAALTITPTCFESWIDLDGDAEWDNKEGEEYLDCGCDRLCPEDDGYVAADAGEGDGEFQAVWMAGFQNNRPASGVHDDLWARAVVFDQGDTRIAIVVVDLVGWFYDDVVLTREAIEKAGLDVDQVVVMASHVHEGPDTMGLWGRTETSGGVDRAYNDYVIERSVEAVAQAVAELREVGELRVGKVDASSYAEIGILNVLSDHRDPMVVDVDMDAALVLDTQGNTIATLAHFGNHPESMADENSLITSDYLDGVRKGLEQGVDWGEGLRPGYGGVALFLTGNVGGMMTPLGITITGGDGVPRSEYTFERTEALGLIKAEMAMDAIEAAPVATDTSIAFARSQIMLPVENWGFQAMFLSGIIERALFDYDVDRVIDDNNIPYVKTEVGWVKIGPIEMLTIPGEVLPEVAVGGYDGSKIGTTYDPLIHPDNPNPPDVENAPAGPYLDDRMSGDQRWVLNLANDELGYIVPLYDFKLHETQPWFEEAEGDHYEETNSLGPQTAGLLDAAAAELMAWVDGNLR